MGDLPYPEDIIKFLKEQLQNESNKLMPRNWPKKREILKLPMLFFWVQYPI